MVKDHIKEAAIQKLRLRQAKIQENKRYLDKIKREETQ